LHQGRGDPPGRRYDRGKERYFFVDDPAFLRISFFRFEGRMEWINHSEGLAIKISLLTLPWG
jgi:hypothetical protein